MISNQTRAARSFDFEITRMISDQIVLHSVQIPLLTWEKVERNWLYFPLRKRVRYIGRNFLLSVQTRCQSASANFDSYWVLF